MKATDVTYFWRRKAPFERLKRELPREALGACSSRKFLKENTQKRCHFPAFLETKYQEFTQILFKK